MYAWAFLRLGDGKGMDHQNEVDCEHLREKVWRSPCVCCFEVLSSCVVG